MQWYRSLFRGSAEKSEAALIQVQGKFQDFKAVLEKNNQILKLISDMEEKSQGEYLLDMSYIHQTLSEVRAGMCEMIDRLVSLGGEKYAPLRERYRDINAEIIRSLPGTRPIKRDDYAIPFEELGGDRVFSVGSKSAQLGQMKRLGLPVPEGFGISAWAYKHFLDANDLQARISERLATLDIKSHAELVKAGEEIQAMITTGRLPDDLAEAIRENHAKLAARTGAERFALRSSAIGEDTQFSFAGQYETFLNLPGDKLVDHYRDVVASKFSPKAIYYFLGHELTESELAMGVGCMTMVEAVASGVTYSRDPVSPEDDCVVVNAVFGLGEYLVNGTLTPDVFRVSRKNGRIIESVIAVKPVRLVPSPDGGTVEEQVPESRQTQAAVSEDHLAALSEYAQKLEAHYETPQDIEWAVDRDGKLYLLQTRPLRVIGKSAQAQLPDVSGFEVLLSTGSTVCPGAGRGPVFHTDATQDLAEVPEGAVLVAPNPFPGLAAVINKVSAMVVEVGGVASHMATISREYRVPTLAGADGATGLPDGKLVTVDATGGIVYADVHEDLITARQPDVDLFEDIDIFKIMEAVLGMISPLSLLDPGAPDFVPENCRTFHDITRFAHQRAMEEMFVAGEDMGYKEHIGLKLESEIPLPVWMIPIEPELAEAYAGKSKIKDDQIGSEPMQAFWNGLKEEGWPSRPRSAGAGGFMSVLAASVSKSDLSGLERSSFALLGKEYMILSLNLGYHFTTIEGMASDDISKNYICVQVKKGGASLERRTRRIKLMEDVLSKFGFTHSGAGDFLDTSVSYLRAEDILERLHAIGRFTMMTKQLDMALSSDALTAWYAEDFMKQLGLLEDGEDA